MLIVNELEPEHLAYWRQAYPGCEPAAITMGAPPGVADCSDCAAVATVHPGGVRAIRVAWRLEPEDVEQLAAGGVVWLSSWGGLLPHRLDVQPAPAVEPEAGWAEERRITFDGCQVVNPVLPHRSEVVDPEAGQ